MFYIYSISQKLKNIKWGTIGIGSKEFGMSRSLPPRKKEFKILAWNRLSLEASTRRTVRPCSMNFNSTVETVFTPCAPPFQLNAVAFWSLLQKLCTLRDKRITLAFFFKSWRIHWLPQKEKTQVVFQSRVASSAKTASSKAGSCVPLEIQPHHGCDAGSSLLPVTESEGISGKAPHCALYSLYISWIVYHAMVFHEDGYIKSIRQCYIMIHYGKIHMYTAVYIMSKKIIKHLLEFIPIWYIRLHHIIKCILSNCTLSTTSMEDQSLWICRWLMGPKKIQSFPTSKN